MGPDKGQAELMGISVRMSMDRHGSPDILVMAEVNQDKGWKGCDGSWWALD